jgi:hypothetical protein
MPTVEIYRVAIDPANVERLLADHDRGELVHSSGSAWAPAR